MSLIKGKAQILKIYLGESDKYNGKPLYEALVLEARDAGMAGATVLKGVLSFGASHSINTMKIFALSTDMPMVIELVDSEEKIAGFAEKAASMIEHSGRGVLMTVQDLNVLTYNAGEKYRRVKTS